MARRRSPEQVALDRIDEAARTGATDLSLRGLGLTTLPESLTQLQNLKRLDVANNQLTALPDSLAQLHHLEKLEIFENQLTAVPDSLLALEDLEVLYAWRNQLSELPASLSKLQRLRRLFVNNNHLKALPDSLTRALRVLHQSQAAENKEHPSLFTLIPSGGGFTHDKWELTLWCQHPGHEHAVEEAIYEVPQPKEWVVRLSPAIKLLGQMLRLAVGVADFSGLSQSVVELTKKQADGMQKILTELPADEQRLEDQVRDEGGRLTPAQGAAFRQLRSLLRELDPAEGWGCLRRFQTNEGDWLWICPVHSKLQQYDPGYPVLGGAAGKAS